MKFLPLIWSGIWRKPGRTILIFLQVSVAFALFGVLQGLRTGVEHAVDAQRADLLLVHSREAFFYSLPLGLLEQIRSIPGVKVAVPVELSGGYYQKPENGGVGMVAVGTDGDWTAAFTFNIAPQYLAALVGSRTAALAQDLTAEKYGWKIGDHIPLVTRTPQKDGSTTWAFDLVGTFTDSDAGGGNSKILINFAYYDQARATETGTVNHFNVAVTDPRLAVPVADAIDRRFANSSHETKTESLRELAQVQVQRIGDLDFLIRAVVSALAERSRYSDELRPAIPRTAADESGRRARAHRLRPHDCHRRDLHGRRAGVDARHGNGRTPPGRRWCTRRRGRHSQPRRADCPEPHLQGRARHRPPPPGDPPL